MQGEVSPETAYFIGSDRLKCSDLHVLQGEKLASAYLRTLAYGLHIGKLLEDEARYHAMLALPLSRSLASLEPVRRPFWSQNLLERWRALGNELLKELWTQARLELNADEIPANIHVVEADDKDYTEIDIEVVLGHNTVDPRASFASSPEYIWDYVGSGCEWGDLHLKNGSVSSLEQPKNLTCFVVPRYFGRIDTYVAVRVKLACLALGLSRGRVRCTTSDVELYVESEVVSRWSHWYADWEPSMFSDLDTNVSGMATVQRTWLKKYVEQWGVSVALLGRVRCGTREQNYKDHDVDVSEFWITFQDTENFVLGPVCRRHSSD